MYILYDSIYIKMHKKKSTVIGGRSGVVGKGEWMGRDKKKGHEETFGVTDILSVVMLSWVHKHLKTFQIVYFEYVEFIMLVMPL